MLTRKLLVLSAVLAVATLSAPFFGTVQHAFAGFRDFEQVNSSDYTILRIDIVPTDADTGVWDDSTELLGSMDRPIRPGAAVNFTIYDDWSPGECVFDIRIVDSGGNDTVSTNINLCTGARTLSYSNS